MFPKSRKDVPAMSVAVATGYVRRMVQRESKGPGDIENAMRRIEQTYGLPFWSLWYLRKGKAKTCDTSLFARIEGAYLDMCQREVNGLLHEIATVAARGARDVDLADMEAKAEALAERIAARKQALRKAS